LAAHFSLSPVLLMSRRTEAAVRLALLLVLSCRHKTPCGLLGGTQSVVRCLFRRFKVYGGHKRARPVVPLLQYLDAQSSLRLYAAATPGSALSPRTLTLASDLHPACRCECSRKASLDRRVIDRVRRSRWSLHIRSSPMVSQSCIAHYYFVTRCKPDSYPIAVTRQG